MRRFGVVLVGLLIAVMSDCTNGGGDISEHARAKNVPVAPALPQVATQCVRAANVLGYLVPCPERVPVRQGVPMDCTPCTGPSGEAGAVFSIDYSGFDVPRGYVGLEGRRLGHAIIEAYRHDNSPPLPCFDAVSIGREVINAWAVTEYRCPYVTGIPQAVITHGEVHTRDTFSSRGAIRVSTL
jgi:hypothetical protein